MEPHLTVKRSAQIEEVLWKHNFLNIPIMCIFVEKTHQLVFYHEVCKTSYTVRKSTNSKIDNVLLQNKADVGPCKICFIYLFYFFCQFLFLFF